MVNKRTASVEMRRECSFCLSFWYWNPKQKRLKYLLLATAKTGLRIGMHTLYEGVAGKKNGSTKEFSVLSFLYFFYLGALFLELLLIFILYGVLLLVEIVSWKSKERLLLFIKIEFNGFKEVFLPTPSIEGVIPSILFALVLIVRRVSRD